MRIRVAITTLLFLVVTHSLYRFAVSEFTQEPIRAELILKYETVVKNPRIYTTYRYEGFESPNSIIFRSWSYDRKERHRIRYMPPKSAEDVMVNRSFKRSGFFVLKFFRLNCCIKDNVGVSLSYKRKRDDSHSKR